MKLKKTIGDTAFNDTFRPHQFLLEATAVQFRTHTPLLAARRQQL
jgi:hypothetical protein